MHIFFSLLSKIIPRNLKIKYNRDYTSTDVTGVKSQTV